MLKSFFFDSLNAFQKFNFSFFSFVKNNENKIKPYWKNIRIILFSIFLVFSGLSIIPIIVFALNGSFWLAGIICLMFLIMIFIDKFEYKLGWIDGYSCWLN